MVLADSSVWNNQNEEGIGINEWEREKHARQLKTAILNWLIHSITWKSMCVHAFLRSFVIYFQYSLCLSLSITSLFCVLCVAHRCFDLNDQQNRTEQTTSLCFPYHRIPSITLASSTHTHAHTHACEYNTDKEEEKKRSDHTKPTVG